MVHDAAGELLVGLCRKFVRPDAIVSVLVAAVESAAIFYFAARWRPAIRENALL